MSYKVPKSFSRVDFKYKDMYYESEIDPIDDDYDGLDEDAEPLLKRIATWLFGTIVVLSISIFIVYLITPTLEGIARNRAYKVYGQEIAASLATKYPGEQFSCSEFVEKEDGGYTVTTKELISGAEFTVDVDSSGKMSDNYWCKLHKSEATEYINGVLKEVTNCSISSNVEANKFLGVGVINKDTTFGEFVDFFGTGETFGYRVADESERSALFKGNIFVGTHFSDLERFQGFCEETLGKALYEKGCFGEYEVYQGTSESALTLDSFITLEVTNTGFQAKEGENKNE